MIAPKGQGLDSACFGVLPMHLELLPLDRTGNRRFIPILVQMELAEVHILEEESIQETYLLQVWAEAMEIFKSGNFKMKFSPEAAKYMKEYQRQFMPEDTRAAGNMLAFWNATQGKWYAPCNYNAELSSTL
jgi:predicted P-loop ATPase